ncbi:hypothetical protein J4E91_009580 [Alternaria rosae]|nr:hypothetical protein J4E91_009580 [Alternaria rosae]
MATVEPNIDKNKLPSEAEYDGTRQETSTIDMDELNQILRKSVDKPPRARHQFSPGTAVLLIFYTLVHIAFIQPVSLILGRQFLIPIIFMLLIELTATTYLEEVVKMFDKYINGMKDLARLSLEMAHNYEEAAQENGEAFDQIEAYRTTNLRMFHQEENEMRLRYYQAYLDHYETLMDYIEPIAKKVKTIVAPPKIAIAEKIKEILDREVLLPEEIDRLLNEAKADLERAQQASNAQTRPPDCGTFNSIASPPPLAESNDGKLKKHYEDMDRRLQSVRDRPVVVEEN